MTKTSVPLSGLTLCSSIVDGAGIQLSDVDASTNALHQVSVQLAMTMPVDIEFDCLLPSGTRRLHFFDSNGQSDKWTGVILNLKPLRTDYDEKPVAKTNSATPSTNSGERLQVLELRHTYSGLNNWKKLSGFPIVEISVPVK